MAQRVKVVIAGIDAGHSIRISVGNFQERRSALPSLRVPERYRAGILRISGLSQEGFDQLLSALGKAPSSKDSRELTAWIGDETPAIKEDDRRQIITALVSLFRVQRNSGVSPQVFVKDVWESLEAVAPNALTNIDRNTFESRTIQLIGQSALDVASIRISDVKQEVERNFCAIRIFPDLRPAFKQDANEIPTEMAVIHNLQIGYHDGMGEHKEFYISLDQSDLEKLKKAIEETEKRAQSLERLLEKSGVRLHR